MSSEIAKHFVELGEIGEFKNGANFNQDDYGVGYPIVNVKQLFRGRYVDLNGLESLGKEVLKRPEQLFLKPGDILFARSSVKRSGAGQCALVPDGVEKTVFSGFIIRFRLNNLSTINTSFLSYLLQSPEYREMFSRIATGTTISNLSQEALKKIPVCLPIKRIQDEVAAILGGLDDRISLLRETNATLESIAQALFKSWFVDFDPVRAKMEGRAPEGMDEATAALFPDSFEESELGLVSSGWRVGTIEDICQTITNGGTPSRSNKTYWEGGEVPWFKTGDFSDGFLLMPTERITQAALESSAAKLLPENAVLMAIYAAPTVGRLGVLTEPAAFNQACTGMVAHKNIGPWFLYWTLYFGRDWFNSRANGAAQQNISKAIVGGYKIVIPSDDVLAAFNEVVAPVQNKIRANSEQAKNLADLRDALLPRLISGKLRLS